MNVVKQVWDRRYVGALSMSREVKLSGFCRWIRRRGKNVTCIEDLERLDIPLMMSTGSVRFPGSAVQDNQASWRVVGYHPNFRRGEIFGGTGCNAFEALLAALMTGYEMITYRKTRPTGELPT